MPDIWDPVSYFKHIKKDCGGSKVPGTSGNDKFMPKEPTHGFVIFDDVLEFDCPDLVKTKRSFLSRGYNLYLFNIIDLMLYYGDDSRVSLHEMAEQWITAALNTLFYSYADYRTNPAIKTSQKGLFEQDGTIACELLGSKIVVNFALGGQKKSVGDLRASGTEKSEDFSIFDINDLLRRKWFYLYFHPIRFLLESLYRSHDFRLRKELKDYRFLRELFIDVDYLVKKHNIPSIEALRMLRDNAGEEDIENYEEFDFSYLNRRYNSEEKGYLSFYNKWHTVFSEIDEAKKQCEADKKWLNDASTADWDTEDDEESEPDEISDNEPNKPRFPIFQDSELLKLAESTLEQILTTEKDELLLGLLYNICIDRSDIYRILHKPPNESLQQLRNLLSAKPYLHR